MIFRGRSGPPAPPLDLHLGLSRVLSIHAENAPNLTNRYLGMFLEGQVDRQKDRQTDGCTDGRRQNNQIRRVLRRLIWFCTFCRCPTKRTLDLYGLIIQFKSHVATMQFTDNETSGFYCSYDCTCSRSGSAVSSFLSCHNRQITFPLPLVY